MKTQIEKREQRIDKLQLLKSLALAATAVGFVVALGLGGYMVSGKVNLQTMGQVADVGLGLYGSSLQLPQT